MATDSIWANTAVDGRAGSALLNHVGFWARAGAAVIDAALLLVITFSLSYLVYGRMSPGKGFIRGPADMLIYWLLPVVVILVLWSTLQATPGKFLVSAKIVDADTGARPGLQQLLVRFMGYFLSAAPLGLGFFWAALDSRKQGWHDKLANTIVVHPGRRDVRFKGSFD